MQHFERIIKEDPLKTPYSPLFNSLNVAATFILPGIASIFTPHE